MASRHEIARQLTVLKAFLQEVPTGLGIEEIERRCGLGLPRRTLQRRLTDPNFVPVGQGKATVYRLVGGGGAPVSPVALPASRIAPPVQPEPASPVAAALEPPPPAPAPSEGALPSEEPAPPNIDPARLTAPDVVVPLSRAARQLEALVKLLQRKVDPEPPPEGGP